MAIQVIEPGLLTTVQDLGRWETVRLGIPTAGAMDPFALMAANSLVGNELNAAGLEITVLGPTLQFEDVCAIAVTGADLGARLDGREIGSWTTHPVRPGAILDFSGRRSGARAYLAVSGGIAVAPWRGSRSTYLTAQVGGYEGRSLRGGDRLPLGQPASPLFWGAGIYLPPERRPRYSSEPTVRVILGPHADRFPEEAVETFLSSSYLVTNSSNRMGYRLQGPRLAHTEGADVSSCGIPLGGIQVPGDGQPIVLMADHQMTGGYTQVAAVIQADIPLVAQCLPGDLLKFRAVDLQEARDSLRRQMESIRAISEELQVILWGAG